MAIAITGSSRRRKVKRTFQGRKINEFLTAENITLLLTSRRWKKKQEDETIKETGG